MQHQARQFLFILKLKFKIDTMKKILSFLAYLTFSFQASSQQFSTFEYFFNEDPGIGNGIIIPDTPTGAEIDFSTNITIPNSLSYGLNFLFIRAKTQAYDNDLKGRWSITYAVPIFTFI